MAAIAILCIHAAMLVYSARIHSPTWDEMAHLPSGVVHWETGVFDLYRVNPPLVRLLASALPFLLGARADETGRLIYSEPWERNEFIAGHNWIDAHPFEFLDMLFIARLSCIPFSLLGAILCYHMAKRLYGSAAGLAALTLWCASPLVLGHGFLITPDIAAASLTAAAVWAYSTWLQQTSWRSTILAATLTGLAVLAKFTSLILGPIFLVLISFHIMTRRVKLSRSVVLQLICLTAVSIEIVGAGYTFERFGDPLGEFRFVSSALGGEAAPRHRFGNRFSGSLLHHLPVPIPANFLQGIDVQRSDFELTKPSYLRGEWRDGGWWYYYLYAFLVKEPLGTLMLIVLAGLSLTTFPVALRRWTVCFLLFPAAAVTALISSQTGFSHHLRYLLPAYPFLYVFASSVFRRKEASLRWLRPAGGACLFATVLASLAIYPHSMSFFNIVAGGTVNGPQHLHNSNIDWGQDLLLLKEWADQNPHARPLMISFSGGFSARSLPIWDEGVTCGEPSAAEIEALRSGSKRGAWYAFSVGRLYDPPLSDERRNFFREREPDARIGYSIYVYQF